MQKWSFGELKYSATIKEIMYTLSPLGIFMCIKDVQENITV